MTRRHFQLLLLLICFSTVGYVGYWPFYCFSVLPRQDQEFLASRPNRAAVLHRFGRPAEELEVGQRFPPTGWYPLPDREVSASALSFVRLYGGKLYLYFDSRGKMEHFVISSS